MKYVENGVPEDFARLTFEGLNVPLCELTEEEYMWVVFGIKGYVGKRRAGGTIFIPEPKIVQQTDESIDVLELSARAEHCLQRAGITTIAQLCDMTEWELAQLRNMGAKSVKEVKEKLALMGHKLKEVSNI